MRTVMIAALLVHSVARADDQLVVDAQTARSQIAHAIESMESAPSHAESIFDRVAERAPTDDLRATGFYNAALIETASGRSDDALESLNHARTLATSPILKRDIHNQLAILHAQRAEADPTQPQTSDSIETSIAALRDAESSLVHASRIDPDHAVSARNLQRVRQRIRQLETLSDQLQQQEQQQQNQDQQSPDSDQLQQLADQQREQAQQSQEAQDNPSDEQREDRQQQQQSLNEQTQSADEQMSQSADQEIRDNLERARQAQERASRALEEGDDEQAAQAQNEAAEALEQAAQRLREQEAEQSESQQQQPQGEPSEEADPSEDIDEIAQRLLEKERREREQRNTYRNSGTPVRVEEDW